MPLEGMRPPEVEVPQQRGEKAKLERGPPTFSNISSRANNAMAIPGTGCCIAWSIVLSYWLCPPRDAVSDDDLSTALTTPQAQSVKAKSGRLPEQQRAWATEQVLCTCPHNCFN